MRKLAKLKGHELSLVPKGANKRQISALKSDKKASAMDSSRQDAALKALKSHDPALLQEISKAVTNADGSDKYTPQAAQVLKAVGRMLAPFKTELTMGDLADIARVVGLGTEDNQMSELNQLNSVAKSQDGNADAKPAADATSAAPSTSTSADNPASPNEQKADHDAVATAATTSDSVPQAPSEANEGGKATESQDLTEGQNGSGTQRGESVDNEDVKKGEQSLAAVMKAHKEVMARNEALMKEVEKHRKAADEARDYQVLEAVKKTVKEDMSALVANADEFAPVLKSLRQLPDQSMYEAVVKSMRAANEKLVQAQKAAGLFTSIGKSADGSMTQGASAEHEIDRKVDELVVKKSEGGKTVNRARVYDHFINETEEGRALYARYHNEERNR